jgi:APA family basic amino acid/polyamine antiporter
MAQKYTRSVATNMVIANMIGTGIFTSLGFQVVPGIGIPDPFAILVIWLVGGIISLCGATVYGEIATTFNKSGGEYTFLTKLYHPLLGFISGWISIIIGFSAAIAGLSIATGEYFLPIIGSPEDANFMGIPIVKLIGALVIVIIALVQMRGVKFGGIVQNYMTYIKLGLVFTFLALPLFFGGEGKTSGVSFAPSDQSYDMIFSLSFAGSLVWVMFAYSGWNASSYIVGNLENPKKNLPFSLMVGTLIVTVLYLLLNSVFMHVATFEELAFQVDLGNVVSEKLLGSKVALFFSAVFSLALISGVNAMFIAGPRVAQQMGKDHSLFKALGKESSGGAPRIAIAVMAVISIILVFTVPFDDIIKFTGFTLSVFALLTVVGIFILRSKKMATENTVKAWLYPVSPIIFIALSLWMMAYFALEQPIIILWFFIVIAPAVIIYFITKTTNDTVQNDTDLVDDHDE